MSWQSQMMKFHCFIPVLRGDYPNTLQVFTKKSSKTPTICRPTIIVDFGMPLSRYPNQHRSASHRLENNQMEWKSLLPLLYESEDFQIYKVLHCSTFQRTISVIL